jgi:hypothetical protein
MAEQTFTSGQILTAAQMTTLQTNTGLNFISSTTVGSAVTNAPVTGCFSATYDNYKITYEGGVASGTAGLGLILGATATGYSYAAVYQQYNATTPLGVGAVATTAFLNAGRGSTTGNSMEIELYRPFLAATTGARWGSTDYLAASGFVLTGGGVLDNTTSYTGFSITCSGITITGGTITVYGYRK